LLQYRQAGLQRAEQLVDHRLPVERVGDRLAEPALPQERVAVAGAPVHVDVLQRGTGIRHGLEAGLAAELRQLQLRLRVDQVHLTAADRLDLGVGIGDEPERDAVEGRPLPEVGRVAHHHDALATRVAVELERAVRHRLPRLRVVVVVVPDLVEVGAHQRMLRV
jgi:hypothetical protein